MLHPDDSHIFERVRHLSQTLAGIFNLPLNVVEPKRRPNGALGLCYYSEGRISILIREKQYMMDGGKWFKEPYSWEVIQDTVCHELAHLVHPNHGKEFKKLEKIILVKACELV